MSGRLSRSGKKKKQKVNTHIDQGLGRKNHVEENHVLVASGQPQIPLQGFLRSVSLL